MSDVLGPMLTVAAFIGYVILVCRYGVLGINRGIERGLRIGWHTLMYGLPRIGAPEPEPPLERCRCREPGDPVNVEARYTPAGPEEVVRVVCSKCWHVAQEKADTITAAWPPVMADLIATRPPQAVESPVDLTTARIPTADRLWPVYVPDPDTGAYLGTVYVNPRERFDLLVSRGAPNRWTREEEREVVALVRKYGFHIR